MQAFHEQFRDPEVRRFNLVGVDVLRHGLTEGEVPGTYRQREAAADVAVFMDAISLPSCIIVGLSMGTIIATQLAVSYPSRVSALFLVSPLGSKETEDAVTGRLQIASTWKDCFQDGGIDEEAVNDTIFGALQLGFNSHITSRVEALKNIVGPIHFELWGPDHWESYDACTCRIFTDRRDYTKSELATLRSKPVKLVVCADDIAYPPDYVAIFENQLIDAGVSPTLELVPGAPHFGSITHPDAINPMLVRFVLDHWQGDVPAAKGSVTSPFDAQYRECGWHSGEEVDSDEY